MFSKKNKTPLSESQALDKLAQLCSASEHCRQEMVEKCKGWGLPSDACQRVADTLVRERFVDDGRYAPIFVRDKARFSGWGPAKVRMQLLAKGVDENLADDAIEAFDKDEWSDILIRALRSKLRSARLPDGEADLTYGSKLFASLVRFALSRGFSYEQARHAIEAIVSGREA